MFENFLSNLSSILSTVIAIVVAIIIIFFFCLFVLWAKHDFLLYYMLRDQLRLVGWLIKTTVNFYRKHWRFALGLFSFFALYLVFYCALPGWTDVHSLQKNLISPFSAIMITVTAALLAKRKMKWALRLAPISTVSITAITAYYLYTESMYLTPQLNTQPFPLQLVALILIPSIISIALSKKLHWQVKTRHQSTGIYLNAQSIIDNNKQNPHNPPNQNENTYSTAHHSRGNRKSAKIEKAYGANNGRNHSPSYRIYDNPSNKAGLEAHRTRSTKEKNLKHLLEAEKERTEKLFKTLFPEDWRNEEVDEKRGNEKNSEDI